MKKVKSLSNFLNPNNNRRMKEFDTNWTRDEFMAYVLIFCSLADCVETEEESQMVKQYVSDAGFKRIHEEFDGDNDYQSIQKIRSAIERFHYSEAELDKLVEEIKSLFMADGTFDIMESNMLMGLRRVLKD